MVSKGMGGTLDVPQGAGLEWLLTVLSMFLCAGAWQCLQAVGCVSTAGTSQGGC